MKTEPFGPKADSKYHESDIYKIHCEDNYFRFYLDTATEEGGRAKLVVEFENLCGFRYLDEGDLSYYWRNGCFRYYNIFEILEGGWLSGEKVQEGILTISEQLKLSEWLICTTNGCITALSYEPPTLRTECT